MNSKTQSEKVEAIVNAVFKKPFESIKAVIESLFENQIYVYPELHRKIESKLMSFPAKEIVRIQGEGCISEKQYKGILENSKDSRKYLILTHIDVDNSEGQIQYLATKTIGDLVSSMMDAYREECFKLNDQKEEIQRLKNPNFKKNFDEVNSELFLGEYGKMRFSKAHHAEAICKILFKDRKSIERIWSIDYFVSIFKKIYIKTGEDEPINMYKAVELKLRRINERVYTHTKGSVDGLIRCYDFQVYVNPNYFHLFK